MFLNSKGDYNEFAIWKSGSFAIYDVFSRPYDLLEHEFIYDGTNSLQTIYVDGSKQAEYDKAASLPLETNSNMTLFSQATDFFIGNLYEFYVFDNETNEYLIHLEPKVRRSDGVCGLLDSVSGEFYTSEHFTAG